MKKLLSAAALAAFAISGHAALQGRDLNHNGFTDAFYDTDLNITWLSDANYALTSGTDNDGPIDGLMTWQKANAWAASVTFGGYTDWRLPTTTQNTSCIRTCTDSEMGHLFYTELGNTYMDNSVNLGQFENVDAIAPGHGLATNQFWSATAKNASYAFVFNMHDGFQGTINYASTSTRYHAMLVRVGDVPEPETYAMLLAGLGVMGAVARRRQSKQA